MELKKIKGVIIAPCTQCGRDATYLIRFPLAVTLPLCIACLRTLRSTISEDTLVRLEKALPVHD